VAILFLGGAAPSSGGTLPLIMLSKAQTKLAKMATKATTTNIFMMTLSDD
jgi:hypothetical protein